MIISNYNNFLNEAKVSELSVGTVVIFKGDYFINNHKVRTRDRIAVIKEIRKIPKQNDVPGKTEFDFFILYYGAYYRGTFNANIITLDSKRVANIEVLGKDDNFFRRLESGELIETKISPELINTLNKSGLYGFSFPKYSDISYIQEDKFNHNNITYIPVDKIKLGKDIEKYRKSEKCTDVLKRLNPYTKELDTQEKIERFENQYFYNNQLDYKIKQGIVVKFKASRDINLILQKMYINISTGYYYEITDLEIDRNDPEKISYFKAEDITREAKKGIYPSERYRESKKAEDVFKILYPKLDDKKILGYAEIYKNFSFFSLRVAKGELVVFTATNEFMQIFTKLVLADNNKTRRMIPNINLTYMPGALYDIDYTDVDYVTYIPAIKYFNRKFTEKDREKIKIEDFFKTYYDVQSCNFYGNYAYNYYMNRSADERTKIEFENESIKKDSLLYKEEAKIYIRINKGEIAKYSASSIFDQILAFAGFKVDGKYFDISSFDIVKTDTGSISFIPAKRMKDGEKYRQVSKTGRVLRKLNTGYTEAQIEKFSINFKSELEAYLNPPDVQVLTGNKISYWYLSSRYGSYSGQYGGTLHNSCMRGSNAQKRVSFYNLFPDQIGLAVFIKNNKLYARALVWKCDDGRVYMDRIYFINPSDGAQLDKYAKLNNMFQHSNMRAYSDNGTKSLNVTLKNVPIEDMNNAPYFDSFRTSNFKPSKENPGIYENVLLKTFFGVQ